VQLHTYPIYEEIISKHPKTRAFLWDMDGTIVNTEHIHTIALEKMLIGQKWQYSIENLQSLCLGKTDGQVYDHFLALGAFNSMSVDVFIEHKNEYFLKAFDKSDIASFFSYDILNFFQSTHDHGLKTAIVTSSERTITMKILEKVGLTHLADIVICREDTKKNKPDKEPYMKAIFDLGLNPMDCICFEDSEVGLTAARDCQLTVYEARWYDS
jgi:beta-phosphoglucomutase